ncbi:hypothetical protein HBI70_141660 [Parastagonospora nodorum]|nr:hypothetical protein HBI70_141660 [Parastagonospora nodorum]KAH5596492.1 hypothetical protein HBI45_174560 [Parastagonospora nodorum]KAH5728040.1 hypothetical protein HBI17_230930 [Parastagonospora nodorum]KAH6368645.1 hypothetical protein HBI34_125990 [Parastagonospora nodorum]
MARFIALLVLFSSLDRKIWNIRLGDYPAIQAPVYDNREVWLKLGDLRFGTVQSVGMDREHVSSGLGDSQLWLSPKDMGGGIDNPQISGSGGKPAEWLKKSSYACSNVELALDAPFMFLSRLEADSMPAVDVV